MLGRGGAGALDADDAGLAAGALDGVGLDHGVVLLVDVAFGADVGAGEQLVEVGGVVARLLELVEDPCGRVFGNGRCPGADGPVVDGGVVGEGLVGDLGDELAVMADAHDVVGGDDADLGAVEAPLCEDVEDFLFAALFGDEEHALLRFGEHDFVGGHAGFALGDEVELDRDAELAAWRPSRRWSR